MSATTSIAISRTHSGPLSASELNFVSALIEARTYFYAEGPSVIYQSEGFGGTRIQTVLNGVDVPDVTVFLDTAQGNQVLENPWAKRVIASAQERLLTQADIDYLNFVGDEPLSAAASARIQTYYGYLHNFFSNYARPIYDRLASGVATADWRPGTNSGVRTVAQPTIGNDLIDGTDRADTLFGGAGDDTLNGGAGNDVLDGGTGADLLRGGKGSDRYRVDNTADLVDESGGAGQDLGGIDTVETTLSLYVLGSRVENLVYVGSGNFSGQGNALANTIVGGQGNDLLDGGSGADILNGGAGDDAYLIDNAGDRIVDSDGAHDGVRTSLSRYTLAPSIEVLAYVPSGAPRNFTGVGNASNNILSGHVGNDSLFGRDGNDIIMGLMGRDTLDGGAGDDLILGGDGDDKVLGGAGADLIDAEAGNDVVRAGDGGDVINGGAGNDWIDGGSGIDRVKISGRVEDYLITVETGNQVRLAGSAEADVLLNVESVVFDNGTTWLTDDDITLAVDVLPATADRAAGLLFNRPSFLSDSLRGTELADTIAGLQGDDRIVGMGGDDFLSGGIGNDTLFGGLGSDTLVGGAGSDRFVFDTTPGSGNADQVLDFGAGDRIVLDQDAFSALTVGRVGADEFHVGSTAQGANDHLLYDKTSGNLLYDPDGNGAESAVLIATFGTTTHPSIGAASFVVI